MGPGVAILDGDPSFRDELVTEIKVRNAAHSEFSFSSAEEFKEVVESGGITAEWEVYHVTAKRWLPITRHPVFVALQR